MKLKTDIHIMIECQIDSSLERGFQTSIFNCDYFFNVDIILIVCLHYLTYRIELNSENNFYFIHSLWLKLYFGVLLNIVVAKIASVSQSCLKSK